ncbi:PPE family protein [Mycobacterium pseudokansasii]|nr:PPE family protein [Mycobacterium pseudokansasii]
MTEPVWMAWPPEVHSAMLSSGPGAGTLLSAAGAWSSLSAEYAWAADELTTLLGAVHAGSWHGASADQYVAAHLPYLAWLLRISADSAAAATQHEVAAAAYTTALAAMPTVAELSANHAVHTLLVATNFFGINTIPIALNEADYARMWIQAATTMAAYQAVSTTALASTPQTAPAPTIVKTNAAAEESDVPFEGTEPTDNFVADTLRTITAGRVNWDPLGRTVNGLPYEAYTDASQPIWWVVRALEFSQDFLSFARLLVVNPQAALQYYAELLLFDYPVHIPQLATALSQNPLLLAGPLGQAISGIGAVTGLAALAELGAQPVVPAVAPALPPSAAAPQMLPVTAITPTAAAPGSAPAPPTAPAPSVVSATAGPAPTPPTTAATGLSYPYLIGGGPGMGFDSGMSSSASASAQRKAPEPETAAAAAAAAREEARARRRRRATLRGYSDEFMDMDFEVDPEWAASPHEEPPASPMASDQGANNFGFAGTVRKETVAKAAGLTTMAGDDFGQGATIPMVPGTWNADGAGAAREEKP